MKARGYEALGDLENAVNEFKAAVEITRETLPAVPVGLHDEYGHFLALSGRLEEAEEVAEELKQVIERMDPASIHIYWRLLGDMELARGNAEAAVHHLERADSALSTFGTDFLLAQALLETGRAGDAASVLEKRLTRYSAARASVPIKSVKLHYFLGLAYEELGNPDKAVEQYETFLDIWKDADSGIAEIDDAKRRLERLTG
jgi:tetratricopeptide (TPR) repeat protein